jgi:ankyrin repeat protein
MAAALSPIMDALYHNRTDEARTLAEASGDDALSVHEAAALGRTARLNVLLEADPALANAWSDDGFQPLGLAAFFGQREAVVLLLDRGGELNTPARHQFHVTALHAALAGPDPAIAYVLLEAGADVNARQQGGMSPLHEAAHSGNLEIARALLARGADPGVRNDAGQTPATIARERGHLAVAELLDASSSH